LQPLIPMWLVTPLTTFAIYKLIKWKSLLKNLVAKLKKL
jgi:hypothetical protein